MHSSETAETEYSSQPALYREAQVWKDIKAETGFASYEDYLKFYKHLRPAFDVKLFNLHRNEERLSKYGSARNETVIYDLWIQETSSTKLSLRCHCETGTELIQALREPPRGVCVQLVLWLRTDSLLNQEMIDTLGLGLRLDLDDFDYRKPWSPHPRKSDPWIKSIFGEQTLAAISQSFMRDAANEVPVVLVASDRRGSYWDLLISTFLADYYGKPPPFCKSPRLIMPFEKSIRMTIPSERAMDEKGALEIAGSAYAQAVQNFIAHGRDVQPTKLSLLLASMSPLLYAEVCRMRDRINIVQETYTAVVFGVSDESRRSRYSQEHLDEQRTELRRITEMNEDILGQFSRYLGSEGHSDLSNQPSYLSVVANLRSLIADARRLEAEVRDFKQIQVGDLSLKESRISIELSNAQIREAKSGKFPNDMCVDYTHVSQ